MSYAGAETLLYAAGDVGCVGPDDGDRMFVMAKDRIQEADIAFCQLEVNCSDIKPSQIALAPPGFTGALKRTGFGVVSFAANHCMDWGPQAFYDTLDNLKKEGLQVVGAGVNIEEARKPVIIENKGNRIAFVSACSVLPPNSWAEANRPGCVPVRARTFYEMAEPAQPGTAGIARTMPFREDLDLFAADVRRAKEQADVVIAYCHWGVHFVEAVIADYELEIARAVIDAGADIVMGGHAHLLKAVQFYKGKPIVHCVCNFAHELPTPTNPERLAAWDDHPMHRLNPAWQPEPGSLYNFPPDSSMAVMVKCLIKDGKMQSVSLMPIWINDQCQPEILKASDERFGKVVAYLQKVTRRQKIKTQYIPEGDEILLVE